MLHSGRRHCCVSCQEWPLPTYRRRRSLVVDMVVAIIMVKHGPSAVNNTSGCGCHRLRHSARPNNSKQAGGVGPGHS